MLQKLLNISLLGLLSCQLQAQTQGTVWFAEYDPSEEAVIALGFADIMQYFSATLAHSKEKQLNFFVNNEYEKRSCKEQQRYDQMPNATLRQAYQETPDEMKLMAEGIFFARRNCGNGKDILNFSHLSIGQSSAPLLHAEFDEDDHSSYNLQLYEAKPIYLSNNKDNKKPDGFLLPPSHQDPTTRILILAENSYYSFKTNTSDLFLYENKQVKAKYFKKGMDDETQKIIEVKYDLGPSTDRSDQYLRLNNQGYELR